MAVPSRRGPLHLAAGPREVDRPHDPAVAERVAVAVLVVGDSPRPARSGRTGWPGCRCGTGCPTATGAGPRRERLPERAAQAWSSAAWWGLHRGRRTTASRRHGVGSWPPAEHRRWRRRWLCVLRSAYACGAAYRRGTDGGADHQHRDAAAVSRPVAAEPRLARLAGSVRLASLIHLIPLFLPGTCRSRSWQSPG